MKTVLINGLFAAQRTTGVQRYAREMVRALGRRAGDGIRFLLAVPGGVRPPEGVDVVSDDAFSGGASGSWRGPVWQQGRLPRLMERTGADLLWSPCNLGPLTVQRQVVTIHDASVFAGPEWFSWPFRTYYRVLLPQLGRRGAHVVTDSAFSKAELARYGVAAADDISVVYPGVSPDFRPGAADGARPRKPYVLTLGSRDPRKNVRTLLEAWGKVPAAAKAGRVLLVAGGEGPAFASEAVGTVPEDVSFTGFVSDEALPALYAGADAFVFPSLYEGFGFPPLEAMACGTPVLSSGSASLPEVCGEAALTCDPRDAGGMAAQLGRMLTDSELRAELRREGIARARRFSWERSAEALLGVFDRVLGRSAPDPLRLRRTAAATL